MSWINGDYTSPECLEVIAFNQNAINSHSRQIEQSYVMTAQTNNMGWIREKRRQHLRSEFKLVQGGLYGIQEERCISD